MRTEDRQGSAAGFQPFRPDAFGCRRAHLTEGNSANLRVRCRGNTFHRNALVNDSVVIANDLRHRHGTAVNSCPAVATHRIARQAEIAKISRRNKGVATRSDREIKAESDRVTPVSKTKTWPETGRRRQRRPATIIIRISPRHPRRCPNAVRLPAPTQMSVTEPTAIVERRPAPRIIRKPIPPAIRIDPMPTIAIRLPPGIDTYYRWLPALAVASHVHPRPVRRQRIVKKGVRRFDCRLLWRIIRNVIGRRDWFGRDRKCT